MKSYRIITEQSPVKPGRTTKKKWWYLEGVFSSAETSKNANGRWYPKPLLEREVAQLQEKVASKRLYGQLGHPSGPLTEADKIALLIEKLVWSGEQVMGRAKVLNTPSGKILQEIIAGGGEVAVSSRGVGSFDEETGEVNPDYRLLTYDAIPGNDPGNPDSWVNGIFEKSVSKCSLMEALEQEIKVMSESNPEEEISADYSEYHYYQIGDAVSNATPNRQRLGKRMCECRSCGYEFISVKNNPCEMYSCPECSITLSDRSNRIKEMDDIMDRYVSKIKEREMFYG